MFSVGKGDIICTDGAVHSCESEVLKPGPGGGLPM